MLKSVLILKTFLAVLTIGFVDSVLAEDNPLRMIPSNNGIVIRLRNPAAIVDKIANVANALQLEFPSSENDEPRWADILRANAPTASIADSGLDLNREWWMYVSNPFNGESTYAFILPLSDLEKFKAKRSPEEKTSFEVHNDWIISGTSDEVDAIKKCIAGELESIETRMTPDARAVFDQGDIGVLVDIRHLINANLMAMVAGPEILKMVVDSGNISFTHDQSKNTTKKIIDTAIQSISALEFTTLSIELDAGDLRIDQYLGVKERSILASFFQDNPGADMTLLQSLPSPSAIYVGLHGNWKSLFRGLIQLVKSTSPKDQKEILESQVGLLEQYEQLKYGTLAYAYPLRPYDQGLLRSVTVFEVDQPDRIRELSEKAEELGDRLGPMKRTTVERATESFGDHPVDVRHLGPFFQVQQEGVPAPDFMSDVDTFLFGPEGNIERTIYLKNRVLQFHGGTKVRAAAALRHAIISANGDQEVDPHFLETRKKLGEKPNLVVLMESGTLAGGLITGYGELLGPMTFGLFGMMNGMNGPLIARFEEAEMDSGVETAEEGGDVDVTIPLDQPEGSDAKDNVESDPDMPEEQMAEGGLPIAKIGIDVDMTPHIDPSKLESLYEVPSFIGFSVTFEQQGCRMRTVIPVESIKRFVRAGGILMETMEEMVAKGYHAEPIDEVEPAPANE